MGYASCDLGVRPATLELSLELNNYGVTDGSIMESMVESTMEYAAVIPEAHLSKSLPENVFAIIQQ